MASVSRTAGFMAMYRALETVERRRAPLFRDAYARRFLTGQMRAVLWLAHVPGMQRWVARAIDLRVPGARTSGIARTAYIDEVVRRALHGGVDQVVVLGAGYDCRAQRMPELARARVFEVDRKPTQRRKRALLGVTHSNYVAVDFLKDDTFARLSEHGWERARLTLFVWEGVTNYLDEAAVLRVLGEVSRCARGSSIVFTYIHRGVIDGSVRFEGGERVVGDVRKLNEPWTFGIAPADLAAFLARAGLTLREDLGADEYRARYLPDWENKAGYAFYRVALAEVSAKTD